MKRGHAFVLLRSLTVAQMALRFLLLLYVFPRWSRDSGPKRLRFAFEKLGGAWLKLGQVLALRFDLLPEAYCYELFKLLYDVKPTPYGQVREIIKEELGDYPEHLFASFDEQSFASASIGQVHRAVLHTGETVAIKVQHPEVASVVRTDISLIYRIAAVLNFVRAVPTAISRNVIDEFARWTEEELDYRIEAKHAQRLRENAADDPLEKVPAVYQNFSSARVLAIEYIDAIPLIDVFEAVQRDDQEYLVKLRSAGHDLNRIARNIASNALNQIYQNGYFHADLHPANLYVLEGDAIAYVDFGIVGELTEVTRRSLMRYAIHVYRGRVERAADELFRWFKPSKTSDEQVARDDLIRAIHGYLMARGPHRKSSKQPLLDILEVLRRHQMEISTEIAMYLKALITMATVAEALAPVSEVTRIQKKFYRRMFRQEVPLFGAVI